MNAIETDKLSKKYKISSHFALDNLTFSVKKGEIYGILGQNGAGKTTLMSILFGSISPSSGSFQICGMTYEKNSPEIRYQLGIVPQEYALYPTLTARENLQYFGSLYKIKNKILNEIIDFSLEKMGLLEVANQRIEYYSGGMKRRINLLAGILHQPKVLFLDEPTVGVDVISKNTIIQYLKELNTNGMSILYTSHHLLEAQELCHRVGILSDGKLITEDTPKQLIESTKAHSLEEVFIHLTQK
ncbi:MAG: ABC transporter ATP-binding protein [Capnocytophaga sp.]|nr:ABC transporter ATP-binding protein [Capnocytophaga sp.]